MDQGFLVQSWSGVPHVFARVWVGSVWLLWFAHAGRWTGYTNLPLGGALQSTGIPSKVYFWPKVWSDDEWMNEKPVVWIEEGRWPEQIWISGEWTNIPVLLLKKYLNKTLQYPCIVGHRKQIAAPSYFILIYELFVTVFFFYVAVKCNAVLT